MPQLFSDHPVWITTAEKFRELDRKTLVIAMGGSRTPTRIRVTEGTGENGHAGEHSFDAMGTGIAEPVMLPDWGEYSAATLISEIDLRFLTEEALRLIIPNPNRHDWRYGELLLTVPTEGDV